MKRILGLVMALVLLAGAALPVSAQTRRRYDAPRRVYYDRRYNDGRSFAEKHRDKLTVAGGTAAGAVLGALAGGKKGAVIGALVGAGGSALYTYKLRDRNERRYRRY